MSKEIQAVDADLSTEQLALVKRTITPGATNDELALFLYDCKRMGVHPLDRMLHFTKRGGRYVPITSIDLMRSRAAETGELAGIDDAAFDGTPAEADFKATVTVWRIVHSQRCSFTATARWSEYYPGDGPGGAMYRKMPHVMTAKCAEALALRKGFPRELHGVYTREEMDQAGPVQVSECEPFDQRDIDGFAAGKRELTDDPDAPLEAFQVRQFWITAREILRKHHRGMKPAEQEEAVRQVLAARCIKSTKDIVQGELDEIEEEIAAWQPNGKGIEIEPDFTEPTVAGGE